MTARCSTPLTAKRGLSSVGRALPLQGRCQEFESPRLHSLFNLRRPCAPGAVAARFPALDARSAGADGTLSAVTTSPIATATATLHTNRGDIKIALFGNHAPKTVANFVGLAQGTKEYSTQNAHGGSSGPFYDGAIFHRVIDGFMIQGGDPTGTGRGGPGYKFGDEFHPELQFDKPYLLAMANAGPGTNGSQFFITVGKTPHLNRKHTIFGEVVDPESQKVVDAIATTSVDRSDRPADDVVIESITIS